MLAYVFAGTCLFSFVRLCVGCCARSACMQHDCLLVFACMQVHARVIRCWNSCSAFLLHLNPSILQLVAVKGAQGKSSLHVSLLYLHFPAVFVSYVSSDEGKIKKINNSLFVSFYARVYLLAAASVLLVAKSSITTTRHLFIYPFLKKRKLTVIGPLC